MAKSPARVFVVSSGTVSAAGGSVPELFDALETGRSGIRRLTGFPTDRLRCRTGGQVDGSVVFGRRAPGVVTPFPDAAPLDLGVNRKLAFALRAAGEALAPLPPSARGGIRVFLGAGLEEVRVDRLDGEPTPDRPVCPEFPPALVADALAALLGLHRPAWSLVSACAASAQAVGEAYLALREGEADLALAGGTDSILNPFGLHAFDSLGALAGGDSVLRPFDRRRTGTLLGEGAACFLLATAAAARRLKLAPLAELLGYGGSLDARHPVMPDPTGDGARLAMTRALADARLDPRDIACINAHGSGTPQNDRAEAQAIRTLFGDGPAAPLVTASKPHFGHLLAAGGAIELLCLLYAVTRDRVPPTLNLEEIDPDCDLRHVTGAVRPARVARGLSNSFGLNGQNAALVLGKV